MMATIEPKKREPIFNNMPPGVLIIGGIMVIVACDGFLFVSGEMAVRWDEESATWTGS